MTQGNWPQPQGHPQWNRPQPGGPWQQPQAPGQWQQPRHAGPWGQQPAGWQQPQAWQQQPQAWQQQQRPSGWQQPPFGQPPGGYGGPGWRPQPPRRSGGFGRFLLIAVVVGIGMVALVSFLTSLAAEPPAPPIDTYSATPSAEPVSTAPSDPSTPSATVVTPPPTTPPQGQTELNPGLPAQEWPELPGPDSSDPDWVTLQQSTLYAAPIPALQGCPPPAEADTMDELEEQAEEQMACIQAAWKPILADLGFSTEDIPLHFYDGTGVETPCGWVEAPALYCSAQGGSIYFGSSTLNGTSWHEFGVKDMAGHEYGHHLQAEAGMFQAEYRVAGGNETARRLELQASCFGYAMISHDDSYELTPEVYDSFEPYLRAVIEDGIHGSKDSLAYWGMRGLYSTTLGNCNTWTVPSDEVD